MNGLGLAIAYLLAGCWLLVVLALEPATAAPQDATAAPATIPAAQPTSPQDQAENTGDDFIRPLTLLQFFFEYDTAPGNGLAAGTTSTLTTDTMKLRGDIRIDLAPQWALGLRADLPFVAKNPISSTASSRQTIKAGSAQVNVNS